MGRITRIDWCDATWNPVTGCLHGCEYCYARKIAERFSGKDWAEKDIEAGIKDYCDFSPRLYLDTPQILNGHNAPYPFGFKPTFHKYRLDEPQKWKKPKTIFVCSMADLFGDWVPDEWIKAVFEACEAAPQHRYLFLTKNPKRYAELVKKGIVMPNYIDWWFGYTLDGLNHYNSGTVPVGIKSFASIEPIQNQLTRSEINMATKTGWVIIGAETGNRKGKVVPDKNWILDIVEACRESYTPVFMKESLRDLMGNDFRQEFPWEV